MSRESILSNARVVLSDRVVTGAVVIRDGLIADVDEGTSRLGEDLGGDDLLPGLVEIHTDHLEYHFTPRPGTRWDPVPAVLAHDAQVAGSGMTTVLDAVRLGTDAARSPGVEDAAPSAAPILAEAVAYADGAGLLRAEHFLHLRCEVPAPDCVTAFDQFVDDPRVRLVSLMDHTPGQRQFADVETFKRYIVGKGRATEAEFYAYVGRLREFSDQYADANRAAIAARAVKRGLVLATHDDATVEHVEQSVALGGTIAEFPTTVPAAQAATKHGQQTVAGAPNIVRGGSQSGNVAATELIALGLVDILSSDYVPASPLQAIYLMADRGLLPLTAGVRLVSTNPARSVGLDDRGEITTGQRADLVRVHPHALANGTRIVVPTVRSVWRAGRRIS